MSKAVAIKPPKHVAEFMSNIGMIPVAELIKLPADQRFDHAALGAKTELAGVLYTGFALMGLKEEVGHGNYLAALSRRTIEPKQAQRSVNLAQLSTRVDASNWTTLSFLPHTKLLIVARFDDEELADFMAGGCVRGITLEDAQSQPVRELERRVRQESEPHRRAKQLEARLEKYEDEYRQDIHRKKLKETILQDIPEAIQQARRYSAVVGSMGMELSIRGQMIFDRTLAADQLHADQNIRAMQFRQSTAALLAGVDSAIKALLDLREHITDQAGDVTVNDIPGLHAIELDEALDNYRWMLDCHGERAEHIGVPKGRRGQRKKR